MFASRPLLVAAVAASLLASCSFRDNGRENGKEVRIQPNYHMALASLQNQLPGLDWSSRVDSRPLKPKAGLVGYQIGLQAPNLAVALLVKNESQVKELSQNMVDLSRALDIDDEAVLLKVRDRAKALDGMLREGKSKYEYDDYLSELSQMEQVIKGYFKDRGNDALLTQVVFGAWLEFLRISTKAVLDRYEPATTQFFNRPSEVRYFKEKLKSVPDSKAEQEFLKKAADWLDVAPGTTMKKEELTELQTAVESLLARYNQR